MLFLSRNGISRPTVLMSRTSVPISVFPMKRNPVILLSIAYLFVPLLPFSHNLCNLFLQIITFPQIVRLKLPPPGAFVPRLSVSLFGTQQASVVLHRRASKTLWNRPCFEQKTPEIRDFRRFSFYSSLESAASKIFCSSSPDMVSCSSRYSAVPIRALRFCSRISRQRLYASSMIRRTSSSISAAVFSE